MTDLEKKYFINVGANGTFANSGQVKSTPDDVKDIFDFLDQKDIEKLLIYFHGGLVSEKKGMAAAELMKNNFADENAKRHVVSFVWETGPIETIVQNLKDLKDLAGDSLFEEATKFVIKLVARKLGISDARGSGEYLSNLTISEEKQKIEPFEDLDKDLNARGGEVIDIDDENEIYSEFYKRLETESKQLLSSEASEQLINIEPENKTISRGGFLAIAKIVAQIAFAVLKRYFNKTHHDFYPTIMEEAFRKIYLDKVGHWGWKQMKDKSAEMFQLNNGRSGNDQYAGALFLQMLEKHSKDRSAAGKKFEVELIGHSAGSIAICNLLDRTDKNFPGIRYNNIFFLAPACRTDLFLEIGKPAKEKGLFQKFKMFTMEENNEKKDHCIPFIYTHSLLYMISGLFENEIDSKIMGLHEQFKATGRYENFDELKKIKTFIYENKLVLSTDIANTDLSLLSNSLKHGDFDNDDYTLKSIMKSISL